MGFSSVKDVNLVQSVLKSVFVVVVVVVVFVCLFFNSIQFIIIIDYSLGKLQIESMH